ncbi:glucose-6-phosphate dehydrogenase [Microbacterium sp. 13-71-7]|jgi:glucose-6-phosphate 1-dehydrogenase|uniref:glucose-6-phosphate dehydrogenase n=1 Tax=Microbacterium sp. 13-71-7 TaxID=1970399 RepID=UPI000BDA1265|nr:glucose-6-phosphate dehydrogenase [Microbacterium sp. 13-71-7]OZB80911.1 MAG: glucose-6-phosphate dehydrogenase [Microbacterium sp. 13-71-7]
MTTPTTLLILGASGDLTSRLLLPAIAQLLQRQPERALVLRGAGSDDWSDERWQEAVRTAFATVDAADQLPRIAGTTYAKADVTDRDALAALIEGVEGSLVIYFALPPAVAEAACEKLVDIPLPKGTVLALEKPFGSDEKSAAALNALVTRIVPETQVFRVDHFLGRSTILNIMGVRFANRLVEPVWSADHVQSVLVRYDESLALENRARYYDKAGALVDMIQSHLLQVLAILAMEQPADLDEIDLRDAMAAALRATRIVGDDPVASTRRARYTAGTSDDRSVPSYADEEGVDPARGTETLAEITCEVDTARWAGVPFTLRSGKALGERCAEIVVTFRPVRHIPGGLTGVPTDGGVLRFSLGPDRIELELNVNGGDDPFALRRDVLSTGLGKGTLLAYTEVLSEILDGDVALSVRGDAAEQCWRIIQPALDAWRSGAVPMDEYAAGSRGPADWQTSQVPSA